MSDDRKRLQAEFIAVKKAQQKAKKNSPKNLTTKQKNFLRAKSERELSRIQDLIEKEDRKNPGPPMKKSEADKKEKETRQIREGTIKDKIPGIGNITRKNAPSSVKKERETDLQRLERIKKSQAKDDADFKKKQEESNVKKTSGKATGTSPTAGRNIRSKHFIGKKLNMGGAIMKNRGGMFKGTY